MSVRLLFTLEQLKLGAAYFMATLDFGKEQED